MLISIIVALLVIGILLWAIEAFPWIDGDIKKVIKILVVVIVALWLIGIVFGYAPLPAFPIRR